MAEDLGYARDSTREQTIDAQVSELRAAGCTRIFVDHGVSSRIADREDWGRLLDYARPGDTIKVRRLDRLAGAERMMIETLRDLDCGVDRSVAVFCDRSVARLLVRMPIGFEPDRRDCFSAS